MQKRIYNFEKIRGVDVTSSPINVAPNRASRMVNMINEDGVNKKRHGWRDISQFEDNQGNKLPINGIFKYTTPLGVSETIVHAGAYFYRCSSGFEKDIVFAEIEQGKDEKSKAYVQGGKLWIVCGGDYLVYDGNTLQPVLESMYAYIPTTSIGIKSGHDYSGESFQGGNLFTRRRKNKLIGQLLGENEYISYVLDGKYEKSSQEHLIKVSVETTFTEHKYTYTKDGEEKESTYTGYCLLEKECYFKQTNEDGKYSLITKKESAKNEEGEEIEGLASALHFVTTYYDNVPNHFDGIRFYFSCPPLIEGEDNITVEYVADYKRDMVISSSNTVSLAAGVDALCLVNNGNVVYFSDFLYGYGYFPDNDYVGVGSEDKPVTAIVTLDNGIGVFKADELYRISINVKFIDEKYVVRLEPAVVSVHYGPGCVNEYCALHVNGDSLIYNELGVHGVISSASKVVNMRSTNVNRELCAFTKRQREEAFAVSHEGRYYLFIGGKVYIADTRFKTYESDRLDSGFEYEWWIWDNCECRCAYSFDGVIYMGTFDGVIRELGDRYVDETRVIVSGDREEIMYDGKHFTFNGELKLEDGETVAILGALERVNLDITEIEYSDGLMYCSYSCDKEIPSIYEGMRAHLCSGDDCRIDVDIVQCDYASNKLVFKRFDGDDFDPSLDYVLAKDPGSYAVKITENGVVLVNEWSEIASFVMYENISAVILRRQNVQCEMVTGVIDFYKLHSKSLYKLAVTPSEGTKGQIEIGYETNQSKANRQRYVGDSFGFLDFDFKSFVFDGGFSKTFVKRIFERNFNYIRFRFGSTSDGPFGIENAQAVYSINNELRGDL